MLQTWHNLNFGAHKEFQLVYLVEIQRHSAFMHLCIKKNARSKFAIISTRRFEVYTLKPHPTVLVLS